MTEIYVIKTTYEKNSGDGIQYFTDMQSLANAVYEAEQYGARVQVYECVPVSHEVYPARVSIELYSNLEK